jgi:maltokinase
MPQHWWNFVSQARWFQGRARGGRISRIHPLPWYTRPGDWPAIRSEVAVVEYPDGPPDFYHLLVGYLDADDEGRDIAQHAGLLRLLWQAWQTDAEAFSPYWDVDLPADLPASPYTGEQSNSSVRFGDTVMVKFFRRLEGNAEVSLLRTLADTGSQRVPRLYGSVSCVVPDLGPSDLAMIVENVPVARDGWDAARAAAAADRSSFAEPARRLGTDLRALHAELAAAFPTATAPGRELVSELAASAVELAEHGTPAAAAARLIAAAARREWPPIDVQRIHADLHLGQCLESPRGWVFVDFEGEPLRDEENRRVEDSVWRDIAGMLRSFDYASQAGPGGNMKAWITECRDAFLEGYRGSPRLTELGQLYELEKAIYEVAYERKYRPEWESIPLGAVADIAADVAAWVAPGEEWQ